MNKLKSKSRFNVQEIDKTEKYYKVFMTKKYGESSEPLWKMREK